jgi:hypothetical protein
MADPLLVWHYLRIRLGLDQRREDRGVITTEFAVLTFLVVAGAIAVVAIIVAAATNNAENIPTPSAP